MSTTTEPKLIRISPESHDRLQFLAEQDRRTLMGEADFIIEQIYLERQQKPSTHEGEGSGGPRPEPAPMR